VLAAGEKSCNCMSDLTDTTIPPGNTAKVTLRWDAKGEAREFHETANVLSNDPDHPVVQLVIRGWVTQRLRAMPTSVTFGQVSSSDGATAQFDLFSYYDDELEIVSHEWVDPETAGFFDARWEPLPAARISQEPHAQDGVRVLLTLKSGLPLGRINQTIRLTTNLSEAPPVEVPLGGKVASDVSIFASREIYNADLNLLKLGIVRTTERKVARLSVWVRGPGREDVTIAVGEVVPDLLDVRLGEPKRVNRGNVIMYSLTVTIPRGSPPVSRLGSEKGELGRIVIKTSHPQAPEIPIRVRFAVQ
jgi:hypothetical protein